MPTTEILKPGAPQGSPRKQLPGPPSWQVVSNTLAFQHDPLAFLTRLTQDYGDICQVQLLIGKVIVLNHPDYVRDILVEHPFRYDKNNPVYNTVRLLFGDGLATAEGRLWRKQRRLLQPLFSKRHLTSFHQSLTESILSWLSGWNALVETGQPIDVVEEMDQLMVFLLSRTIFSDLEADEPLHDLCLSISESIKLLTEFLTMPFPPPFVPTKRNRHFKQSIQHLDRIIYGLIDQRRSLGKPGSDLLGMLLAARDEESGEGMSERQLRDELVTFFTAGSDTSAQVLTWIWYLLSEHPEVQERLDKEVDRVLAGRIPTISDLPQLVYTRMIIDEALRLYAPIPILMRRSLEEQVLEGYQINKHALVLWSTYLLHRHPAYWQEPERFFPEREKPSHHQDCVPFGAGPRICIGQHFALTEMILILAMVASRYRLQRVPGQVVEPVFRMTLQPRNGLRMYIRTRDQ